MITITRFDSLWDITPKTEKLDWEEAVSYFCPQDPEIVSKKGRSKRFSLNTYNEGTTRAKKNVEAMTGLVFDFDNTDENDNPIDDFVPIPLILKKLHENIYFWYTTYHNTTVHPRWRLVLPFENPLSLTDWNDAYEGVLRILGNPPGLDKASKDITHMWLQPYKNPAEPFESGCNLECDFLDPKSLSNLLPSNYTRKSFERKIITPKNFPQTSSADVWEKIQTIDPDCYYQTWIKIGMALHHHFNGSTEGLSTWATWSQRSAKFPGYDELERHWNSFGSHPSPVTIASVMHMARNKGYISSPNSPKPIGNSHSIDPNKNHMLAPPSPIQEPKSIFKDFDSEDFLEMHFPPIEMLLDPIIPSQGLTLLYAPPGIGKTFLSLTIGSAVAAGENIFNDRWTTPNKSKVLFVDGEMPAASLQERLRGCFSRLKERPKKHLRIFTRDAQDCGMPDLSTIEGQQHLEPLLEGKDLLILDNLSSLLRSGDENEASSWNTFQAWLLTLRSRGISVLVIHHANKKGGQRGTSKKTDVMDTVIVLKRPKDYETEQGARFEVHYEKTRGFHGEKAKPFEAWLKDEVWEISECMEKTATVTRKEKSIDDLKRFAPVIDLMEQGLNQKEIAAKLGINRTTVYRNLKKSEALNLYTPPPDS